MIADYNMFFYILQHDLLSSCVTIYLLGAPLLSSLCVFVIMSWDIEHNDDGICMLVFCFLVDSPFHSHSRVFNIEHNSYPKMSIKQPLDWHWVVLFTSVDKHYL
jgi:hypothetical protein